MKLTPGEIASLRLADADLVKIEWIRDPSCPTLCVALELASSTVSLAFRWVKNFRIDLDTSQTFRAMTWDVCFKRLIDDRWQVKFDFPGDGYIEFDFESIHHAAPSEKQ